MDRDIGESLKNGLSQDSRHVGQCRHCTIFGYQLLALLFKQELQMAFINLVEVQVSLCRPCSLYLGLCGLLHVCIVGHDNQ